MKAITYIPTTDIDKLMWLNNLSLKMSFYANTLGISSAEVTALQKDAAMFNYIINMQEMFKQTLQQITSYKSLLKYPHNQQHLGALPNIPTLPAAPAPVPEGMFERVSKLVQRIKASPNYTTPIGNDLGIIAASSKVDTLNLQPKLKVTLEAGQPRIKCTKGIADGMDLYVDRKDGNGFVLITRLFILDYLDKAPIPGDDSIKQWSYKAMYVKGNDNIGLMSAEISVVIKRL